MTESSPKKCCGTGKAKGYGCGNINKYRKLGLGMSECRCYAEFLYNTPVGKEIISNSLKTAKKYVAKKERKYNIEKSVELMSIDEYRSKIVQPIFNEIARLIDYGQPCIATGYYTGKMSGGHFIAVGSNRTICLNLHNIHIQSFSSNSWKGGDNVKYKAGILRVYGQEYLSKIESLQQIKPIHLTKSDLIQIKNKAIVIRNRLRGNLQELSPKERIELRENINLEIGIYN